MQTRSASAEEFGLVVVGSGSAAFAAGIKATELGASVALCESDTIGGTCVNRSCVPSKALLAAADLFHRAGHNPSEGVVMRAEAVDLEALVKAKDELVGELRRAKYEDLAAEDGLTILRGRGAFVDSETFTCDGRVVRAARYLIATGASPSLPPIPG